MKFYSMKKRILILFALAVVTVGAWADDFVPYITIQKKSGFAATNMNPLEVTGTNPDARATYEVELEKGSHTFWIVGHYLKDDVETATSTNTISFSLAEPQRIIFYATHPQNQTYVFAICNAYNYGVGDNGWVLFTNLKASYGATTESYFASNSTAFKRFVVTGYQAQQPDYLIPGKNSDIGILTQGTGPTKDRINKAELNYLTGVINYSAVEDVPVKISAAGVSTLLLPVDATIPSGVKAYTLKYDGNEQLKGTEVVGTIPANTPVLLDATPGTYNFHVGTTAITYEAPSASADSKKTVLKDIATTSENVLTGTLIPHCVPENSYVLQNGASGVGFYKVTGTSTYKIDNFRCYIPSSAIPAEARSLSIVFDDDVTTGIADVRGQKEDGRSDIFNLSGQRVGKDYKGVVIKNGRKMIQK